MNINQAFPSKTLTKDDLSDGAGGYRSFRMQIDKVTIESYDNDDGTKDTKPALHFVGAEKAMALNRTNANILTALYGEETDNWYGKGIELYFDPTIQFRGKLVGGLRLRAIQNVAAPAPAPAPAPVQQAPAQPMPAGVPEADLDDGLPF